MISQILQDKHDRLIFLESIVSIAGNFFNVQEATDDFFSEFEDLINELVEEYNSVDRKVGLFEQKTSKLKSFLKIIKSKNIGILNEQFTNYTDLIIKLQDSINMILFEEHMSEKDFLYIIEKQNEEMLKYWQEQKINTFKDKTVIIENMIKNDKIDTLDLQFSYLVDCK